MIVVYPPDSPQIKLPGEFDVHNKKLLVVFNLSPEVTSVRRIVSALLAHPDAEAVVVFTAGEASEWNYLHTLAGVVCESFGIKHLAVLDSGINAATPEITFIPNDLLFRLVDKNQQVIAPEQRQYHFSLLNRVSRSHRVRLVLELERRGLLDRGAVSCGSSNEVYDYQSIVPSDKLHMFPMMLDGIAGKDNPIKDASGMYAYVSGICPQQRSSVINIVSESSFDPIAGKFECWSRGMYTEKTSKCFLAYQLPLFLAVKGYVSYVRHLGFDVFDDIINHAYDDESDPVKRIQMLADEAQRLVSRPLPELQQLLQANWHRLEANANNVFKAADHTALVARQTWDIWVNNIRNS